jgi:hypothetical protein
VALEGSAILLGVFFVLLFLGVPIGVSLGVAGFLVIAIEGLGVMALPTNIWTGIAKYPLLRCRCSCSPGWCSSARASRSGW